MIAPVLSVSWHGAVGALAGCSGWFSDGWCVEKKQEQ